MATAATALLCLALLIGCAHLAAAQSSRRPQLGGGSASVGLNSAASVSAASATGGSQAAPPANRDEMAPLEEVQRPPAQQDADLKVTRKKRPQAEPPRRPQRTRPKHSDYVETDDENCYDDEDDGAANFGNMFDAAARPMRNFMNNMFRQMHHMASAAGE